MPHQRVAVLTDRLVEILLGVEILQRAGLAPLPSAEGRVEDFRDAGRISFFISMTLCRLCSNSRIASRTSSDTFRFTLSRLHLGLIRR